MFLFLSFIVALIALYYLGVMTDAYNPDTTYLTPLVTLLVYSLVTLIREVRKGSFFSWLLGEDNYDYYHYPENPGYNGGYNSNYNGGYNNGYTYHSKSSNDWSSRQESTIECFLPDKEVEKDNTKELTHYPSNQEVRDKMSELEKSRWFRIKRSVGGVFGIDVEGKYREEFKKPYKTNEKVTVKQQPTTNTNREDHNRFKPNNEWWTEKETREYNEVAKHVGRSCEIALADIAAEEYQPVNAEANGI